MKRLLATAIMFLVLMISRHTHYTEMYCDTAPKMFNAIAGDGVRNPTKIDRTSSERPGLQEPADVLNQAYNLLTPALKMFQ